MADIYAVFGSLIFLGVSYPAMLAAWRLLFPGMVERSRQRITTTPWKCLGLGLLSALIAGIPAGFFFALPSQGAQVIAWIWVVFLLGLSSVAAAGLAGELGERIRQSSGDVFSPLGAFLRGAVLWELASVFPLIGWILVLPAGLFITFGAGVFSLLSWMPRVSPAAEAA